ncbi:MAG: PilN domain-containing protein [Candidatus Binatia bacterium]
MIRLNLLPVREIKAEVSRRQDLTIAFIVLALTLALLFGLNLFQSRRLTDLRNELANLQKEIKALNVRAKGVADLEKKIRDLTSKRKVIEQLDKKKTGPVRVMESLSSATPPRLWLTRFKETGGNLTVNGIAVDNQTIADFLKALSRSVYFNHVELIETTQMRQGGTSLKKFSVNSHVLYASPLLVPSKQGGSRPAAKEGARK